MSAPLLPLRVLAIDDQPVILRTLKVMLGVMGITAFDEAVSIDAAEERLRDGGPYDLIVCDLNLPGRDGIEFLRGKKATLGNTGIILLSGEDERILQSVTAMGRAAGLNLVASLTKPATAAKFADALEHLESVVPSRRRTAANPLPTPKQVGEFLGGKMLDLHYQPIVRIADRAFVGVEALLRGTHPEYGDVVPTDFLKCADLLDRAGEVTRFVLEAATAAAGRFHADGLRITMSMNLDGSALRPQLPDMLADLATKNGVPVASLTCEIAEPAVLVDYTNALESTTRLRLKRCGLSLDQFGSGAASLRQLQELPFTELKIDRSFVTGCDRSAASRAMIAASVGVARAVGMKTVAVGIETQAEWDAVKSLGVDLAQGMFMRDALPESQVSDWQTEWALQA